MALVDDLLNDIADAELRARLQEQVATLRKEKKFGLVFEQHHPEMLCINDARIHRGVRVAHRNGAIEQTYIVDSMRATAATCRPEGGGESVDIPLDELTVVKKFGEPVFPVIAPVDHVARGGSAPHHVLIEADNYHALQLLEWLYAGRVDCIYIDPPYNTGARDWKYNNDYVDLADSWRHSKWLAFMQRRLQIARRLLKPDGVLIVTIDEHEVHHLGMLLEDTMRGYLQEMVTVVINPKGTGKLNFARVNEHAIYCIPDLGFSVIAGAPTRAGQLADAAGEETEDGNDADGEDAGEEEEAATPDDLEAAAKAGLPFPAEEASLWELRHARRRGGESSYRHQRWRSFYPLWIDPERRVVVRAGESLPLDQEPYFEPQDGLVPLWPIDAEGNHRCWRYVPKSMNDVIDEGRVVLGRYNAAQRSWTVNLWVRKAASRKLKTVWWDPAHDAGTHGTSLINRILGRRDAFPFPKSVYAVRDAIAAVVRNRPNAIVLDFFAGSGTTLHGLAMMNAADGGRRQCILVTNNEVSERNAQSLREVGVTPGSPEWEREGICQAVTWPRCKAAIEGKRPDGKPIDGEWSTDAIIRTEVPRTVRALSFASPELLKTKAARKALASALGIGQNALADAGTWYIAPADARDRLKDQAVLFDTDALDAFTSALLADGAHIRTIHLLMPENSTFRRARDQLRSTLPPLVELADQTVPFSEGLTANLDYFRLGFIDPDALEMGGRFSDLLPALWMMAGARGAVPVATGSESYLFPEGSTFAVLLREAAFPEFNDKLAKAQGVEWVFIITDSREAFVEISEQLATHISPRQRVHLYRNYIDNFQINGGGGQS